MFSRTDALAKHVKSQHPEAIPLIAFASAGGLVGDPHAAPISAPPLPTSTKSRKSALDSSWSLGNSKLAIDAVDLKPGRKKNN